MCVLWSLVTLSSIKMKRYFGYFPKMPVICLFSRGQQHYYSSHGVYVRVYFHAIEIIVYYLSYLFRWFLSAMEYVNIANCQVKCCFFLYLNLSPTPFSLSVPLFILPVDICSSLRLCGTEGNIGIDFVVVLWRVWEIT